MIKVTEAENYRTCNVCHSGKDVKNIMFRYKGTNTGTQIALCRMCIHELVLKLGLEGDSE